MTEKLNKPNRLPTRPFFSSGPTVKYPGWSESNLAAAVLSRSHRSSQALARIQEVIELIHTTLDLPDDWRVAIVPASNTGALEMSLWNLLGCNPVDILDFDSFGHDWVADITKQLQLKDTVIHYSDYGKLPDLNKLRSNSDLVLVWNGTTSGACIPQNVIQRRDSNTLTICDATSSIYAQPLPWDQIDVATFSWQKVIGGEAAHGILLLGPNAIKRLENYTPSWPIPKIFRLTSNGKVNEAIFSGSTINTISMLCIEDALMALKWVKKNGGFKFTQKRCNANAKIVYDWADESPYFKALVEDVSARSNTSICLSFNDEVQSLVPQTMIRDLQKSITKRLEKEGGGFDIAAYRSAPAGFRIWSGATVEQSDIAHLLPWLDWAAQQELVKYQEQN